MEKMAKKFLQRMINKNGFIADGVYDEFPRYWHSNNKCSSRLMDITLYHFLYNNGYIIRDRTGRFLVSEKGKQFATPWYKRILG